LAVSDEATLIATVSHDARIRVWDAGTDFGATAWTIHQLRNNASFAARSGGDTIDALVDAGGSTLLVGHTSGSITAVEHGNSHSLVELQQVRPRHDFLRVSPDGRGVLSVSPAFESARLQGLVNSPLTLLRKAESLWAVSSIKTDVPVMDATWTDRPNTVAVLTSDKRIVLGTLRGNVFSETASSSVGGNSEPARIAAATGADVMAVSFQDGSVVTFDHGRRSEFKARMPLRDIVLSKDGKYLAVVSSGPQPRTVVRDVALGETLIEIRDWISDAAFDPGSKMLLLGSDPRGELILYDLRRMQEQSRWLAHSGGVRVVTFSADGKFLYSAGNDGEVRSWPIKVLDDVRDEPPRTIREHTEQATGLMLGSDGEIRSRPVSVPRIEHIEQHTLAPPDSPQDVQAARAVFATEDDDKDKEQVAAPCGKLGDPDHANTKETSLGVLAAAAMCADMAGRADDARSRYRSFLEAAVAQGNTPGRLLVSPGLARGAGANLARSIESKDDADLSTALQLINLVYLSSWRDGSIVRLPPTELVGDYVKALESVSEQTTLQVIDKRMNEFIDGLGHQGLTRTASSGEAESIPRLLFNVGVAHMSHDDAPGAYDLLLRAADQAGRIVGDLAMSGDSSETEARQFWTQVLAGSAALACQVAAQASDEKKDAVNGHSETDLLKQAKELATQAFEQWKILGEHTAQDDDTKQSMVTLRDTFEWCARLPSP
jgi:WD40 repeat protein